MNLTNLSHFDSVKIVFPKPVSIYKDVYYRMQFKLRCHVSEFYKVHTRAPIRLNRTNESSTTCGSVSQLSFYSRSGRIFDLR